MLKMYLNFNESLKYISWELKLDTAYIERKKKGNVKGSHLGIHFLFLSPVQRDFPTWKAPHQKHPSYFHITLLVVREV